MSSALLANLRTKKEPKKLNPITIKFGKKLNSLPILDKRQEDDMKNRTNILGKFNKANPVKNDQPIFENEPIQPAFRPTKDTVEDTVEDTTYVPKYNSKLIVVKLKDSYLEDYQYILFEYTISCFPEVIKTLKENNIEYLTKTDKLGLDIILIK